MLGFGRRQAARSSTKEESLELAKQFAEDWYLELRGKDRAGLLKTEKTFRGGRQFLKEYEIITEGQRSPRWVEGHGIRLRLHLIPFFGDLGVSEVTAGQSAGIPRPPHDLPAEPNPDQKRTPARTSHLRAAPSTTRS